MMNSKTKEEKMKIIIHGKDHESMLVKERKTNHHNNAKRKRYWLIKSLVLIAFICIIFVILFQSISINTSLTNQRSLKVNIPNLNIDPDQLQELLKQTQQTTDPNAPKPKFDLGKLFSQMKGFGPTGRKMTNKMYDQGLKRRMQVFTFEYNKIFGTKKKKNIKKGQTMKHRRLVKPQYKSQNKL